MTLGLLACLTLCAGAAANLHADVHSVVQNSAAHAAAVAKAQAAHARLRTVQRQLSGVNAKMQSDLSDFLELSREQDEKDAREGPFPSSFIEKGAPSFTEMKSSAKANQAKSAQAHAHLAEIQKQLASVNAKMQADMQNVLEISRQQDEEDMHDSMPSSFIETGRRFGEQVPPGLEDAAGKLHAVEEQLRRMDHQFKEGAGESALPNVDEQLSSFVQESPNSLAGVEASPPTSASYKEEHEKSVEYQEKWKKLLNHRKQEREEYDAEHEQEDAEGADGDADSLLQTGSKKRKLAASLAETEKTLAFAKEFLEENARQGSPKVEKALKEARKQEKAWEATMHAESQARINKFDAKFEAQQKDE